MGLAQRIGNATKLAFAALRGSTGEGILMSSGGLGTPPQRNNRGLEEAPLELPWVSAVNGLLSNSCARQRWSLLKAVGNSSRRRSLVLEVDRYEGEKRCEVVKELLEDNDLETVSNHPLPKMINGGNGALTGSNTRRVIFSLTEARGLVYIVLDENIAGVPCRQWPLPASWCKRVATPSNPYYRFAYKGWSEEVHESRVLTHRQPAASNPYFQEHSHSMALREEYAIDQFAAKHLAGWFFRGANPPVFIGSDEVDPDNTTRPDLMWRQKGKKGLPFWARGKDWFVKVLGFSFEQQTIVPLRKHLRDTVLQVNGIPPELLGIVSASNRSTIALAETILARFQLLPRLESMRDTYECLLGRYKNVKRNAVLAYTNPVPDDVELQLKAFRANSSAPRQSEWRRLMGLPKIEGTDVHLVRPGVAAYERLADVKPPETPLQEAA